MRKHHLAVASLCTAVVLFGASQARAEHQSTKGPAYIEGNLLGFASITQCVNAGFLGSVCAGSVLYSMDFEGGYHFSGRHDGMAIGLRQGFYFGSFSAGSTQARFGYDIPIPISEGKYELVIAPYGVMGIAYGFSGGDPSFAFGFGGEGRFFIGDGGFYVAGRPIEIGGWVPGGFTYKFDLGAGYAF
jgi:hypothetical protein